MAFNIKKTELQKAIESFQTKKQKLEVEITGITDCKTAIEAGTPTTEYVQMQITAYQQQLDTLTEQVAEIDEVITKLTA